MLCSPDSLGQVSGDKHGWQRCVPACGAGQRAPRGHGEGEGVCESFSVLWGCQLFVRSHHLRWWWLFLNGSVAFSQH